MDTAQPIKLAVLVPLSAQQSSAAQLAQSLSNAAQLGVKDANDPLLSLSVYDTGGDPGRARAMAERAINEGAKLIIGPLLGSSAKAVAGPAAKAGIKVIAFSTDTTAAGDPVFLSGFTPEAAARRIVSYARARGLGQIGVFYPQTAYGDQAIRGATAAAAGNVVASTQYARTNEGIPPAAKEFAAEARAKGARAVLLAESGQALGYVSSLLRDNGVTSKQVKFIGLGEWNSRSTLQTEGLKDGWFPAPDPKALRGFVDRYNGAYGSVPQTLAVLGYDAARIAGQLVREARASGSKTPFSTETLTRRSGFPGAVGPIRFDKNGLAERAMAILRVDRRVFETIDPAPTTFGAGS